jgi:hypothetical protein
MMQAPTPRYAGAVRLDLPDDPVGVGATKRKLNLLKSLGRGEHANML